ncbi:hypothetical protein [Persicobacter psychrovividus]|uniref:Uncharacterized protein n=1 Tax=Persicobacter psychrovividus TaxID=387638 RepID=A0ABM7VN85_9BACT|nr:hypothetical protein PEPS_47570 [Persicobacter psychrovividus]
MKIELEVTIKKEYDVKYLRVEAFIPFWEDARIDGSRDKEGKIPCRQGDMWKPCIEIETGRIINWEKGVSAETFYKVRDTGMYYLLDAENKVVAERGGYALACLGDSYGDYIELNIDAEGMIEGWKFVNEFKTGLSEV